MSDPQAELIEAVRLHFPDAVDVLEVSVRQLTEQSHPLIDSSIQEVQLVLVELEPETPIYAAMSPHTHRVYVYFDHFWR